ncbi:P2Y purinoceptor 8-like [Symphorus nematophorus]
MEEYDAEYDEEYDDAEYIVYVVKCVIIGVGLPLTLMAIYALYTQVRKDHVAPIYVINLLISDLIQLCCMIVWVASNEDKMIHTVFTVIYVYCLMVSISFMVCIAVERYLGIAHPLWYHFRRTIKSSVVVCVLVWVLLLVCVLIFFFCVDDKALLIIFGVLFLLPLPLFIFFLGGTLKALSASRVPSDEKRRIVGVLVLVLLIYTLLFLPAIIIFLSEGDVGNFAFTALSFIFVELSPLADLTLYIFMRKGIIDKLLSSVCCCRMDRMDSYDTTSSSV